MVLKWNKILAGIGYWIPVMCYNAQIHALSGNWIFGPLKFDHFHAPFIMRS